MAGTLGYALKNSPDVVGATRGRKDFNIELPFIIREDEEKHKMELKGFIGVGPEEGTFIPAEEAYTYALERCAMASEKEKEEFVEWYYSGNWTRTEEEC